MMWKTLIFLAAISVAIAGHVNKHQANYAFQIKHDYDYLKHHEKLEHHKHEAEEQKPQEDQVEEQENNEAEKEEEPQEEVKNETEQSNESDASNAEPEEPEKTEEYDNTEYEFLYKVRDPHTHDNKGQHEKKHDGEIKGVYWLLQPDGYKRTVDYHADKHNGFHAKVDYSKSEENENEEENAKPKSEYFMKIYHGLKKPTPIKEEQEEEQEQDKQEESAMHIPIYVF